MVVSNILNGPQANGRHQSAPLAGTDGHLHLDPDVFFESYINVVSVDGVKVINISESLSVGLRRRLGRTVGTVGTVISGGTVRRGQSMASMAWEILYIHNTYGRDMGAAWLRLSRQIALSMVDGIGQPWNEWGGK